MAKNKQKQADNKDSQAKQQPLKREHAPSPRGRDGAEIDADVADDV